MIIEKIPFSPNEQAEKEYTDYLAAKAKAVNDYNIMMGNIEDPEAEEDEDE